MNRFINSRLCALALLLPMAARAGVLVPESVIKDIDDGYGQRALIQLRPLVQQYPKNREVQYRYGAALVAGKRLDEAQTAMKTAIEADPDASELHRVLGEAYGMAAEQAGFFGMIRLAKLSLAEFETAVKLNPNDPDARADLAAYYIQAPGVVGGSLDKAHEQEAQLDKLAPLQALQTRAAEAEQNKQWDAADKLLRQAVSLDKKADSLTQLGMMQLHAQQGGNALVTFKLLTVRSDVPAASWFYLGRSAAMTHSSSAEGIAALKYYIALAQRPEMAPRLGWAHLRLAELYAQNNQKDLAAAEIEVARKMPPSGDSNFEPALEKVVALVK